VMRDYLWHELVDLNRPGVRFLYFMLGFLLGVMLALYLLVV
jgi:hypothetical protein